MNDYKKDFENALRMIDWQNDMIRQHTERMADLQTTINFLESECKALREQLNGVSH